MVLYSWVDERTDSNCTFAVAGIGTSWSDAFQSSGKGASQLFCWSIRLVHQLGPWTGSSNDWCPDGKWLQPRDWTKCMVHFQSNWKSELQTRTHNYRWIRTPCMLMLLWRPVWPLLAPFNNFQDMLLLEDVVLPCQWTQNIYFQTSKQDSCKKQT